MARVLITGSRTWDDSATIVGALWGAWEELGEYTLVSGACPLGADRMCEEAAMRKGIAVERHPARWNEYGNRAGFVRNAEMVNLGADLCLAFIKDSSRGASMTADLAEKAGIRTIRFTA
ncbi:SLOG family protein [Microbacterium sp. F51-2R]|uniref:SLOG family protein n=1 Tax=Microbacterium sp. F51-2R TaxID=3445777 RepID=UPI003F9F8907